MYASQQKVHEILIAGSTSAVYFKLMKTLKLKFKALDATYEQIGNVAGVGKQAVSNWIVAESIPSNAAIKVAKHYKVSLDWLFDVDPPSNSKFKVGEPETTYSTELDGLTEKQYIFDCINSVELDNPSHKILLDTLTGIVRLAFDDNAKVTSDYTRRNPCRRIPESPLRKDDRRLETAINKKAS